MIPGWYGKIPATGDFVVRRLPASFTQAWDRWLHAVLGASRERLGAGWQERYLSMPAWRFVLGPNAVTDAAWAGLMLPSVDSVGRFFPLTVAAALPPARLDPAGTLLAASGWFDQIEAIALRAIAPRAADIDAALKAQPFSRSTAAPLPSEVYATTARLAQPGSAWLAEESEVLARSLLLCETLPGAEQFCAMLDGRWAEHGWVRHALEPERA